MHGENPRTFGLFSGNTIQVPILRSTQLANIKHAAVNMHDCQFKNMKAITLFQNDSWV